MSNPSCFIELTSAQQDAVDDTRTIGSPPGRSGYDRVWIRPDQVGLVMLDRGVTWVETRGGSGCYVQETPEQVLSLIDERYR